jgi:hypothetical protein
MCTNTNEKFSQKSVYFLCKLMPGIHKYLVISLWIFECLCRFSLLAGRCYGDLGVNMSSLVSHFPYHSQQVRVSTKISLHPFRLVCGRSGMTFLSRTFISKNTVSQVASVTCQILHSVHCGSFQIHKTKSFHLHSTEEMQSYIYQPEVMCFHNRTSYPISYIAGVNCNWTSLEQI